MIAEKRIGKIVVSAIIVYLLIVGLKLVLDYDSNMGLADNISQANGVVVVACTVAALIGLIVSVLVCWICNDNH